MQSNGITIDDNFAVAFPMKGTRLIVTAYPDTWARHTPVTLSEHLQLRLHTVLTLQRP